MHSHELRLHHFLPVSQVNGPGRRAVVWVQGCTLGCPGCFNPETHAAGNGNLVRVDDLFSQIDALRDEIEGVTISGGEPLQQRRPLERLLQRIHAETSLTVLMFSGYSWTEIQSMPRIFTLLDCVDVLLAGRYDAQQRVAAGLLGSSNKTIHLLTSRYTAADLQTIPQAEVIVGSDGEVILSGIDPVRWTI
ncbi:MAG TPA: 4Fe-4S single cluster domain-containing protein [Anaerolineaceae bacterium]